MPAEMSVDLKQCIIDWYLVDQYTYHQIASLADCSIGHASNVMRNFQEFGQVKNPFNSHTSCPSQIKEGDIVYLHALLEAIQLSTLISCKLTFFPSGTSIFQLPPSLKFLLSMNWCETDYTKLLQSRMRSYGAYGKLTWLSIKILMSLWHLMRVPLMSRHCDDTLEDHLPELHVYRGLHFSEALGTKSYLTWPHRALLLWTSLRAQSWKIGF